VESETDEHDKQDTLWRFFIARIKKIVVVVQNWVIMSTERDRNRILIQVKKIEEEEGEGRLLVSIDG
jgi:hypothetical protein